MEFKDYIEVETENNAFQFNEKYFEVVLKRFEKDKILNELQSKYLDTNTEERNKIINKILNFKINAYIIKQVFDWGKNLTNLYIYSENKDFLTISPANKILDKEIPLNTTAEEYKKILEEKMTKIKTVLEKKTKNKEIKYSDLTKKEMVKMLTIIEKFKFTMVNFFICMMQYTNIGEYMVNGFKSLRDIYIKMTVFYDYEIKGDDKGTIYGYIDMSFPWENKLEEYKENYEKYDFDQNKKINKKNKK